jgi:allophanate hydrolase
MDPSSLLTLPDWQHAYRDGASPRRLLEDLRARLDRDSPREAWIRRSGPAEIDASVTVLEQRAACHPDRATALRAMPLFGVPFAVKDNIDVAGLPTTAACPAFARTPTAHAQAVARLIDAGAVCMGKTNLDQFATGLVGLRSPYGRPSSTFAADRISGGSSSGSAVVVSRGDVPFALGTDTAGSGRVPAGFNNIVGLKPTPGRVSNNGVVPACRSVDCVSVLALTVADAAAVLALIEGPDPHDAYSAFRLGPAQPGATLRIGVPVTPIFGGDAGYAPCFEQALAQARTLGHMIVPIDFAPLLAVAKLLYGGPWVAERHTVVQELLARDPDALDATVRAVIEAAHRFSATDTFRAQYMLREAQRDSAALWQQLDLLMVPTAPAHPTHADIDADPLAGNARLGIYTNFVNLLGWCALALPAGFTAAGLPFGVTFIAPAAADAALARFGQRWATSVALPLGATGRQFTAPSLEAPSAPWPASQSTLPIAVVGAHLSGLPLNGQLGERGATLREATQTAPHYRLFALPDTVPPKPGLMRVGSDASGAAIAVEVWDMPLTEVGAFLALIPPPLGLGSLELADGRWVHGFVCEAHALVGARDVTAYGGWRAFVQRGDRDGPPR